MDEREIRENGSKTLKMGRQGLPGRRSRHKKEAATTTTTRGTMASFSPPYASPSSSSSASASLLSGYFRASALRRRLAVWQSRLFYLSLPRFSTFSDRRSISHPGSPLSLFLTRALCVSLNWLCLSLASSYLSLVVSHPQRIYSRCIRFHHSRSANSSLRAPLSLLYHIFVLHSHLLNTPCVPIRRVQCIIPPITLTKKQRR